MKFSTLPKAVSHSLIGSVGIGIALCGLTPSAEAVTVNRGTDYVVTPSGGALFNFVDPFPGIGVVTVSFQGLPIGTPTTTPPDGGDLGSADTVINRLQDVDATATGGTTPLEIVGLSLRSVAPVNIGGTNYDVFAGLQKYLPGNGTLSTGSMTIRDTGGVNGKTWDSSFTINGVAILATAGTLTPTGTDFVKGLIGGCPSATTYTCIIFSKGPFEATNEPWTDVRTNQLEGANLVAPGLPQNFYMTGLVIHDAGGGTIHTIDPVPEPLTMLGASAAIAFGAAFKKKRRQSK